VKLSFGMVVNESSQSRKTGGRSLDALGIGEYGVGDRPDFIELR
jgi:hypothetical protein